MNKTSLTRALLVAGAVAMAGAANADAIFYPDGSVVELGSDTALEMSEGMSSADTSLAMDSSLDTSVLGAGPAKVTKSTTGPIVRYEYVQPNIHWDRTTAMAQMRSNMHLSNKHHMSEKKAAGTFNVPSRAGEASTMTGGAPNMVTDNERMIVGSYRIPLNAVTGPYYVFSH